MTHFNITHFKKAIRNLETKWKTESDNTHKKAIIYAKKNPLLAAAQRSLNLNRLALRNPTHLNKIRARVAHLKLKTATV